MPGGSRGAEPRGSRGTAEEIGMYELMGRAHAATLRENGQGTVEYVGLVLLIAAVLAGVVAAAGGLDGKGVAQAVVNKLKDTITNFTAKA